VLIYIFRRLALTREWVMQWVKFNSLLQRKRKLNGVVAMLVLEIKMGTKSG